MTGEVAKFIIRARKTALFEFLNENMSFVMTIMAVIDGCVGVCTDTEATNGGVWPP